MRARLLVVAVQFLLLSLLSTGAALAQSPVKIVDPVQPSKAVRTTTTASGEALNTIAPSSIATGTITSTQAVSIATSGFGNVRYAVSGTWTGTLYFESTIDGTNWMPTVGAPVPATILGGAVVASTTVNGNWESRVVALQRFRVRGVVTGGTANVTIVGSAYVDFVIAGMLDDGVVFATTTTPLGAGATWQSPVIDMLPYASETTAVYADAPSAADGVVVEVSHDGVTWYLDHATTYTNSVAETYTHNRKWRYSRLTYTNGATPQTVFTLQIILQRVSPQTRTSHFSETLHEGDTGILTRSVLSGQRTSVGDGFVNVGVTSSGALMVDPTHTGDGMTDAWAKMLSAQHEVQVSLLWPHGFNTRILVDDSVNGGGVTYNANNQNATLATGVNPAGGAGWHSRSTARFTPQQAVRMVFSTRGFTCVVGNRKVIGVGTDTLGYFMGCDPTTGLFGVMYRNGTGDHWTPRASFNGYKFDGSVGQPVAEVWDPTMTGFYAIDYRMGTGTTQFFMAFPSKEPSLLHEFRWRNSASGSSVAEGFLPMRVENVNVGSTANNTFLVGPQAILAEAGSDPVGVKWAYSNRKASVPDGVATNLFTLRNNTTWNGTGGPITNRVRLRLQAITAAVTGGGTNATALCEIRLDPTVAGAPVFTDIHANDSISAVDVAGTTVTGGSSLFNVALSTGAAQSVDLSPYRFRLNPGERYVFTCMGDGASVDVRFGANWVEEW